MVVNFAKNNF